MINFTSPARLLFGVQFTPEQWAAAIADPPRWDLNPPQREEYNSDYDYALGEREYADRVIRATQPKSKPPRRYIRHDTRV
jgi:hypothetical protein